MSWLWPRLWLLLLLKSKSAEKLSAAERGSMKYVSSAHSTPTAAAAAASADTEGGDESIIDLSPDTLVTYCLCCCCCF